MNIIFIITINQINILILIAFNRKTGKKINETNLWSNSMTKDILTKYAEGIACHNFDVRHNYNVRRIARHTWYVLYKNIGKVEKMDESKDIKYDRVRTVIIDNQGYMSCSCGYVQRMLMPCWHICAIIDKREYYIPSMFHVRWYKTFSYYYRPITNENMREQVLHWITY